MRRRFHRLGRAVCRAQEDEERQLSRALHDGLSQTLTALVHRIELLCNLVKSENPAGLAASLEDTAETARAALDESRGLSRLLLPSVLEDFGLPEALLWIARSMEPRDGLRVDLELDDLDERLPPEIETLIFRVVQVSLDNVFRHSGVTHARVTVKLAAERVTLRVSDFGRGFDSEALWNGDLAGAALHGLRDRLELFGGRLDIVSSPHRGTYLSAEVPLERTL